MKWEAGQGSVAPPHLSCPRHGLLYGSACVVTGDCHTAAPEHIIACAGQGSKQQQGGSGMTRMQGAVGSPRQRCHQGTPGMFAKPFLLHQQRHALGCLTPPSLFPNPPLQEHPPPQTHRHSPTMPITSSWKPPTILARDISSSTGSLSTRGPRRSCDARRKRVGTCACERVCACVQVCVHARVRAHGGEGVRSRSDAASAVCMFAMHSISPQLPTLAIEPSQPHEHHSPGVCKTQPAQQEQEGTKGRCIL